MNSPSMEKRNRCVPALFEDSNRERPIKGCAPFSHIDQSPQPDRTQKSSDERETPPRPLIQGVSCTAFTADRVGMRRCAFGQIAGYDGDSAGRHAVTSRILLQPVVRLTTGKAVGATL